MQKSIGGEGGIRTLGEIAPTLPFQGSSIGRSDTSPLINLKPLLQPSLFLTPRWWLMNHSVIHLAARTPLHTKTITSLVREPGQDDVRKARTIA